MSGASQTLRTGLLVAVIVMCAVTVQDVSGANFKDLDAIFWKGDLGRGNEDVTATEPKSCSDSSSPCFEWNNKLRLKVEQLAIDATDINCTVVNWEALDCTLEVLEDCFDLTTSHWYGGSVNKQMYWPIERITEPLRPYVTGDSIATPARYGPAQERYWLNSNGTAVYIDWEIPLWVSINQTGDQQFCLRAQYTNSPYHNYDDSQVNLTYTVCQGNDVRHIHDYMTTTYLKKPTDIPDERVFRYPIWSTWAQYKTDINQTKVIEFATEIRNHGFSNSQLEIDDRWELHYGDLEFDAEKFPDPRQMVETLNAMGFRATLWVHPFVSLDSPSRDDGMIRRVFVTDPGLRQPALTTWWAESSAMTIDFTGNRGVDWYVERLTALKTKYNISSFKFDAGETFWLPNCYVLWLDNQRNPSIYSTHFAEMAYVVDSDVRHQEVRVGAQTQHLPIFVRMLDKDSRWGSNNGIETLIPHALNQGIIGYPFVLPDMVGGNAYGPLPDKELFIRWVELNAFLPSIQYSIAPWQFDDELLEITRNMTELHESFAQKMIDLARESTVTGAPIIRPLWWIAPTDPVALTIDSEFLVGDDLLVAPVVKENARSRDIYLPAGSWQDELRHDVKPGGQWFLNYTVELNEVAYFTRIATA